MRLPVVTTCDLLRARLEWGDGRHCEIEIDRCSPVRSRTVTCVTSSGRVLCWADDALFELASDRRYEPIVVPGTSPLEREVDAFRGLVALGTSAVEAAFAVDVVRILARMESA